MIRIEFSYNWNNKLASSAFTSIRLENDSKYIVGEFYEVALKDKKLFDAELVAKRSFFLHDINEFIARIDTGYSKEKCIEIIQTMYKNKNIDWTKKKITLLLFVAVKNTVITPEAVNEKIAMFCRKYEQHTKLKYKTSPADSGKVKLIKLTNEILDHYFTSDNHLFKNKYSISNITKYYNELMLDMTIVKTTANFRAYPNNYSESFAKKLSMQELGNYYQHLISQGLVPKHDRLGNLIGYSKPQPE